MACCTLSYTLHRAGRSLDLYQRPCLSWIRRLALHDTKSITSSAYGKPLSLTNATSKPLTQSRKRYRLPIHTLRMPFQRIYVINAPQLIQAVQKKTNLSTFVPTLLDFGMLFSGLNRSSKETLVKSYGAHGNGFTKSVHKYLAAGPDLHAATRTAVEKLTVGIRHSFGGQEDVGLYETLRHQLCLALTGAIYGAENPYDDPVVEASWLYVYMFFYTSIPYHEVHMLILYTESLYQALATYYTAPFHSSQRTKLSRPVPASSRRSRTTSKRAATRKPSQ